MFSRLKLCAWVRVPGVVVGRDSEALSEYGQLDIVGRGCVLAPWNS